MLLSCLLFERAAFCLVGWLTGFGFLACLFFGGICMSVGGECCWHFLFVCLFVFVLFCFFPFSLSSVNIAN